MKEAIRILLVEDDDIDTENVIRAFKKNKMSNPIYIVGNGEEALDFLRHEGDFTDPLKSPRPGIILLDINMPIMNGIEFLQIVKADDDLKSIPVVVLTTSSEEKDRIQSFELSVAGYIVKPVEFEDFVKAVETINVYWTLSEIGSP